MKVRKLDIQIVLLLLMMHNMAQLVGINQKIGFISYHDIVCAYSIFFFLNYYKKKSYISGYYAKVVLFVPVLIFFSAVAAKLHYNQSILSGILTQRGWLCCSLLYFPLNYLVKNKYLTLERLFELIRVVVFFECIVMLFQYIIGPNHYFLAVRYTERYDSIRIIIDPIYMLAMIIYSTQEIFKRKKVKLNLITIALIFSYILLVNKGRQEFIVFIGAVVMSLLTAQIQRKYKLIIVIAVFIFIIFFIQQSELLASIVSILTGHSIDGTYQVRLRSRAFYLSTMQKNPTSYFFGYGMQNTNIDHSMVATGANNGFLITDNGIYGFFFSYGLVGLCWYLYSTVLQVKRAIQLYKYKHNAMFLIYVARNIALFSTVVLFFYSMSSFGSIIWFVISEALWINTDERKKNT